MRFALIATGVAAAVAVPLALAASGPQMSGDQFLIEVRCTAYAEVTRPGADTGETRWRLNAEAMRQPAETVAAAEAEVNAIAQAAIAEESSQTTSAPRCADAMLAAAAPAQGGRS